MLTLPAYDKPRQNKLQGNFPSYFRLGNNILGREGVFTKSRRLESGEALFLVLTSWRNEAARQETRRKRHAKHLYPGLSISVIDGSL